MAGKPQRDWDIHSMEFANRIITDPVFFAREVLGADPWPVQEQILYSIRDNPRTLVQACHASGKCLEENELVTLANGKRVAAHELVGFEFNLPTLVDGKVVPVRAIADWNTTEEVYRITTESGRVLVRNGAHPLWAGRGIFPSGNRCKIESRGFTPVRALEAGELLALAEELPVGTAREMPAEEVKLLAYLIGDGGLTCNVTFTQQDNDQLSELKHCATLLGGTVRKSGPIEYRITGGGARQVRTDCSGTTMMRRYNPIIDILRRHDVFGKHSRDKRVPDQIFSLSLEQQALFLSRLYSTDGWASLGVNRIPEIGFCSVSEGLCRDVQHLLLRFGVHGRLLHKPKVNAWCVVINASDGLLPFAKRIGIFGKEAAVARVKARAEEMAATNQRRVWRHKKALPGTRWERIVSIEKLPAAQTVAIGVPGCETFLTDFYEHNSFVASIAVLWFMITRPPATVFTSAPTGRQVEKVLWAEIAARFHNSRVQIPGRLLLKEWKISHNHFAFGFSTDSADSFQGIHQDNVLGIFDEASGMDPAIWEAAEGNLSTFGSHFLGIGNPLDPASEFYRRCHRDPRVKPIVISAYDTPYFYLNDITEEDIFNNSWREKFDETRCPWRNLCHPEFAQSQYDMYTARHASYVVRVKGEFPDTADNALIPFWAIHQAQQRWTDDPTECDVYVAEDTKVGVDVAEGGMDLSARAIVSGGYCHRIRTHAGFDPIETAGEAAKDFHEFEATLIRVDSIGIGSGTVAELRRLNLPHIGINVGAKSRYPKRFQRVKAEGWWHLRELFVTGKIAIPPDDRLLEEELSNIHVEYPEAGVVAIESKDNLRERIHRSPDRADALMLACIDRGGYGIADSDIDGTTAEERFDSAVQTQKDSVVEQVLSDYMKKALRHAKRRY